MRFSASVIQALALLLAVPVSALGFGVSVWFLILAGVCWAFPPVHAYVVGHGFFSAVRDRSAFIAGPVSVGLILVGVLMWFVFVFVLVVL